MTPFEHDIMIRIQARDPGALDDLMAAYGTLLQQHLQRLLRDTAAAEDLAQEVFLRVWGQAEQWREPGSLQAWLLRIATNLALNHLRAIRRRREQPLESRPSSDVDDPDLDCPAVPRWMVDHAAVPPDQTLEQTEQHRFLKRWVDALPDEKRTVFRLVHEAGMDIQSVAETLNIPAGTVKSRLHYTMQTFIKQWRDMALDWEEEHP